jgi:hypothetical protein
VDVVAGSVAIAGEETQGGEVVQLSGIDVVAPCSAAT